MKIEIGSLKILGSVEKNACVNHVFIFNFKWIALLIFVSFVIVSVILYKKSLAKDAKEDYYVTASSGIVHNATCRYYGKTKGFYLPVPGGYQNCKSCGGGLWKKKGFNESRKAK